MKPRASRCTAVALAVAGVALAMPAGTRAGDPVGDALVARFGACFEAQGGVLSEEDRAVLASASPDLAAAADITVDGVSCGAGVAPDVTSPGTEACIAAANALECDAFGADLGRESDSLAALPPPPPWAVSYVGALLGRTSECYAAEVGAPVSAEQRAQLEGFGTELASGIGVAASGDACKVHEDQLASCTSWLAARACDALLGDLDRMLGQSDGSADGTVAPPPVMTTTTADGLDVETANEAEVDEKLAAAQSDRQSAASQLIGPCAALVDCSTDLDATLDAEAPPDTEP